jgi:molybdopterin-guanine dinucleotide biosynthesis protein A
VLLLAGGASARFGSDKLLARIGRRPSLARVVAQIRPLARRVTVSVHSEPRERALRRAIPGPVEWIVDEADRWGPGPGGAIARGLVSTIDAPVLVVPGDMPWMETASLRAFARAASESDVDIASPVWADGVTEHLVQWHRDPESSTADLDPVRNRDGSFRASTFLRALRRSLLVPVGSLTRDARVFAHLTYATDLRRPRPRGSLRPRAKPLRIVGEPKRRYAAAMRARADDDPDRATREFLRESLWYERAGLPLLARHAGHDARATVNRPRGLARDP